VHLHSDKVEVEPGHGRAVPARFDTRLGPAPLVARRGAPPEAVFGLQRAVGNAAVVQLLRDEDASGGSSPVLGVIGRGGGQPLDVPVRSEMERAFGVDLGAVRVHTDGPAAESAQAVQSLAYTVGDEIVFGAGQYRPASPSGQRTLAHELTHVVQQRNGPVSGTPTGDGISLSDPSDSFERAAEANADRIMSAGNALASPSGSGASSVQRQAHDEEEDTAQAMRVQREAAPEDQDKEAPV
jgi:hypothetical protein